MNRNGVIALGAVGFLVLVAILYFPSKTKIEGALIGNIETFVADLPDGQTLTWETLTPTSTGLAVMKNPVYTNVSAGLTVTADTAVVGLGSMVPPLINVQLDNPVITDGQLAIGAKGLSVKGIDSGWFDSLSQAVGENPEALFDVDRWRTFTLGPVVLEGLAFEGEDQNLVTALSLDRMDMEGIKAGVVTSLSLSGFRMTADLSAFEDIRMGSYTVQRVDLAWMIGMFYDSMLSEDVYSVLYAPDRWATFTFGPETGKDFESTQDGDKTTLATYSSEGFKNGRLGRIVMTDMVTDPTYGPKSVIGTLTFSGLDMKRVGAYTTALLPPPDRWSRPGPDAADDTDEADRAPDSDTDTDADIGAFGMELFGINEVSLENVTLIVTPTEKRHQSIRRLALVDVTENAEGRAVGATIVVDGVDVPLADTLRPDLAGILKALDLQALKASGKLTLALDEKTRGLTLNPLSVDLGPLGSAQATVDVVGFDDELLTLVLQDPLPFLTETALNSATLAVTAGPKTGTLLDFFLEKSSMTRGDVSAALRQDRDQQDPHPARQITAGVASFVEHLGTLRLSVAAKGAPISLGDFIEGLTMDATDIGELYTINVGATK